MLKDELLTCPCVKICYSETTRTGTSKFGAVGIVDSGDDKVCQFNCSGCYIMTNNLIPLVHKCHENHTRYEKGSLLHFMNTYSYANHLFNMGQDTAEDLDDDTEVDDD